MAKKTKGLTKRALFSEGVYALSNHVRRAIDITRQDHPLREVQDMCQGLEALMTAAENAADLGYALEIIAAYQPMLFHTDEVGGLVRSENSSPDDSPDNPEWPF